MRTLHDSLHEADDGRVGELVGDLFGLIEAHVDLNLERVSKPRTRREGMGLSTS